jgi:hypothetical protein
MTDAHAACEASKASKIEEGSWYCYLASNGHAMGGQYMVRARGGVWFSARCLLMSVCVSVCFSQHRPPDDAETCAQTLSPEPPSPHTHSQARAPDATAFPHRGSYWLHGGQFILPPGQSDVVKAGTVAAAAAFGRIFDKPGSPVEAYANYQVGDSEPGRQAGRQGR